MHPLRATVIILAAGLFLGTTSAADAPATAMKLCGWFVNPTPGNSSLLDRSGEWLIGTQGGEQADGDWPEFTVAQWVETNGHHGYGCACMRVTADPATRQITAIKSAYAQSLSVCRKDHSLPAPP